MERLLGVIAALVAILASSLVGLWAVVYYLTLGEINLFTMLVG